MALTWERPAGVAHTQQMANHDEACPPLELPAGAHLKLSYNGTHRAPWDAALGWSRRPTRPSHLADLKPAAGLVPLLDVVVVRRYGWQFMEGACVRLPPRTRRVQRPLRVISGRPWLVVHGTPPPHTHRVARRHAHFPLRAGGRPCPAAAPGQAEPWPSPASIPVRNQPDAPLTPCSPLAKDWGCAHPRAHRRR